MAWSVFGGLVSPIKRCVKKTLGNSYLDFYEMQVVLKEIEFILNPRPIRILYDNDLEEIITPNHLLFGHNP